MTPEEARSVRYQNKQEFAGVTPSEANYVV